MDHKRFTRQLSIFLPVIAGLVLYGLSISLFIIPQVEEIILKKKMEMIRELTQTAWSVLKSYDDQVNAHLMSRTEAEAHALSRIRMLRYGTDGKDYFWINDLHPYMIMHPYQVELVGMDLSYIKDAHGKFVFRECVKIALRQEEGFVDYFWQWKDNDQRITKKLSYVKLFKPWGWIVGTGVYIDDIEMEVGHVRDRLVSIVGLVFLALVALAVYIMKRGLDSERERSRLEDHLRKMATTDSLTEALNRRHFWERANQEIIRHQRYRHPMAVLELDVDRFKSINDTYGHPAGDKVLVKLAKHCIGSLRKNDIFGRIGGEEFVVLLVETNQDEALEVAERIRKQLSEIETATENNKIKFTISIGLTTLSTTDMVIDDILKRADEALYSAKRKGRNRTEVA